SKSAPARGSIWPPCPGPWSTRQGHQMGLLTLRRTPAVCTTAVGLVAGKAGVPGRGTGRAGWSVQNRFPPQPHSCAGTTVILATGAVSLHPECSTSKSDDRSCGVRRAGELPETVSRPPPYLSSGQND